MNAYFSLLCYNSCNLKIKGYRVMKLVKISVMAVIACSLFISVNADDSKPKRELKGNKVEVYNTLPSSVDKITDAFKDGVFTVA